MINEQEMAAEVVKWIESAPKSQRLAFLRCPECHLSRFHFGLGKDIRNQFCLWERKWEPQIDAQGTDVSPDHPDAISMRVIRLASQQLRA